MSAVKLDDARRVISAAEKMQAVGMVNDHLVDCFRYREVATA
jgi:3-methyladenine DNA glycosylase Tag